MRVAVIANRNDADDGYVGDRFAEHGAQLDRIYRDEPASLIDAERAVDVIVLLGSDWSVYDERRRCEVRAEQELVRRAQSAGVPMLAICYGAQLVASAVGLSVTRAEHFEIGWKSIVTDDPTICPPGPWFEFHGDRWTDAKPVSSFARTDLGPQAFRVGRTLAVQFHPEVTLEMARRWLYALPAVVRAAEEEIATIEADTERYAADAYKRCSALVDVFLSTVAGAPLHQLSI